jgi:hypothetical protein
MSCATSGFMGTCAAGNGARAARRTTMTTKDGNAITAMGLFRRGLDHDIKTKEQALKSHLEGLRREIDRAIAYLADGNRVSRGGVCLHRGIEIDALCVTLNELYDVRIGLNAAIDQDAKGGAA